MLTHRPCLTPLIVLHRSLIGFIGGRVHHFPLDFLPVLVPNLVGFHHISRSGFDGLFAGAKGHFPRVGGAGWPLGRRQKRPAGGSFDKRCERQRSSAPIKASGARPGPFISPRIHAVKRKKQEPVLSRTLLYRQAEGPCSACQNSVPERLSGAAVRPFSGGSDAPSPRWG